MSGRVITEEGGSMRSLWRILALQWLGGDGSDALTGDSTVLESLLSGAHTQTAPAFDARREPGVSHRAMMSPGRESRLEPEIALEEVLSSDPLGHNPR
jgi:hypothetical protein